MITTVTLNPMLDKTVSVESLERGKIHRAVKLELVAGGKGINVSRQLKQLGLKTTATGFLGGEIGSIVQHLLRDEGIDQDFVITDAMTREGITYREPDGTYTAVFEPSARIEVNYIHELNKKLNALAPQSTWMVCSGSSPGLEADDLYYEAIIIAHRAGIPSVLDSYGYAFELALNAIPALVKPNKHEFETTFGRELRTDEEFLSGLDLLLSKGVQYSIITNGANPCYAAVRGHYWKITPPKIPAVNPTGSGDATIAGILYGFRQGWKFERCLSFGVAAGAANARKWEIASSSSQEIQDLESQVVVQRLQ
ncbi:MAG: 1-phosphofructokinase family hexose kinase [Bacteroidota bacterium]